MTAPSWRDVLDLQKEMRADLASYRAEVAELFEAQSARIKPLEDDLAFRRGQDSGQKKILGMAQGTFAIAAAIVTMLATAGVTIALGK